jgi:LPXTG-motif cell wall-anchored protein
VGGVVGGLALLGIAGWLLWRRRRNGHHEVAQDEVPELSAEGTAYAHMKAGGDISELSSNGKPVELEQPPAELDATERVAATEERV